MHWDHADGVDLFPKAQVWIQKDEFNYYTGEARPPRRQSRRADAGDDVSALVKLNTQGRVRLVDGDAKEIIPGVTVYTGGRHTFASQYVGVNTKSGRVVIASDNLYLYENLDKHVPIAQTFDAKSNLAAQDRMKQLATSPRLIIPGHDPEVFVRTRSARVYPRAVDTKSTSARSQHVHAMIFCSSVKSAVSRIP